MIQVLQVLASTRGQRVRIAWGVVAVMGYPPQSKVAKAHHPLYYSLSLYELRLSRRFSPHSDRYVQHPRPRTRFLIEKSFPFILEVHPRRNTGPLSHAAHLQRNPTPTVAPRRPRYHKEILSLREKRIPRWMKPSAERRQ
jgi:hypothetical protein